jgi:hypothetical protein
MSDKLFSLSSGLVLKRCDKVKFVEHEANKVAIAKGKANAGQGGKLGHSNQHHWVFTEEVKEAARKQRRLDAKIEIKEGLAELEEHTPDRNAEVRDQKSEVSNHISDL